MNPPLLPGQTFTADDLAAFDAAHGGDSGIDADTVRLFLATAELARPFIARLHGASAPIDPRTRILIVRGAFWREHAWTGARGERIARIASTLNLSCETIDTPSLGTLSVNAGRVTAQLRQNRARCILISLSKGSADVKAALAAPDACDAFANVTAWIDLSGTTEGTPVIGQLRAVWWRWLAIRVILKLRRQPITALVELDTDAGPLSVPPKLPAHLNHIRILGFPQRRHLSHPWAVRAFERLAHLGPNDGGAVLLDRAIGLSPRSTLLPVWAADHYMRTPWNLDETLTALIRHCASAPASSEPHASAGESDEALRVSRSV